MKNTLIIPSKIKDTVPKPTKAQIIEALVERARAQHEAKEEAKRIKREAIEATMVANAIAFYAKHPTKSKTAVAYDGDVTIEINVRDAKNEALLAKSKNLGYNHFYADQAKKTITDKLKAANPLLGNDDVTKQLDQLLASIMGQPKAIEVEVV
jgi:hypothetical protein